MDEKEGGFGAGNGAIRSNGWGHNRNALKSRANGIAERGKHATPKVQPGVRDAIADLTDYLTDPDRGTTTGVGGEVLVAVKEALLGEPDLGKLRSAVYKLNRLRERNSDSHRPDVPPNHRETNGPGFMTVLGTLESYMVERAAAAKRRPRQR